ncbi:MAG: GNAT family N-acetyltransferase [Gemmatimonadota bacterium]
MDLDVIHGYLTRSFWAAGISRDLVERSLQHSLGFGIFEGKEQVGFARVISDQATFAYVCDVFVLESHQGRGLALLLMEAVRAHPALQGLRRWLLFTKDAHGLYRKVGFTDTSTPERVMEIFTRHGMKP